jgi:hypothetical protein
MEINPLSWYEWFLQLINVANDFICSLLGMLPNPDPFPEIFQNMNFDYTDMYRVAWYWLDSFCEMEMLLNVLTAYFEMFALAWIILALWKWIKVR